MDALACFTYLVFLRLHAAIPVHAEGVLVPERAFLKEIDFEVAEERRLYELVERTEDAVVSLLNGFVEAASVLYLA